MIKIKKNKRLSVFLVESMRADDVYNGMLEAEAIAQILRLLNVNAASRNVVDKKHLKKAIREAADKNASVFHISCHANQEGFDLTADEDVAWDELADLANGKLEDMMLCLSACEAGNEATASAFKDLGEAPSYIVGPVSNVLYAQACVAWSVFYHHLAKYGISKEVMQEALKRMNDAVESDFMYRRWDGDRYLRYPPMRRKKSGGKGV